LCFMSCTCFDFRPVIFLKVQNYFFLAGLRRSDLASVVAYFSTC